MDELIDCMFTGRPHGIGCWIVPAREPVLVDPGPASSIDALLAGLADRGTSLDDMAGIVLTHVHLDHAGAAGALVRMAPHLRVHVYEAGARHMVDPARLVASAGRLWGERMGELWGRVEPVPVDRIVALEADDAVDLGDRELHAWHALGHANHHVLLLDGADGTAYTGDMAGIGIAPSEFVLVPTPPPDIDLAAWEESLIHLDGLRPTEVRLTHFGAHRDAVGHIGRARAELERLKAWRERAGDPDAARDFAAWMDRRLHEAADATTADMYGRVAQFDLLWLGLDRHFAKSAAADAAGARSHP